MSTTCQYTTPDGRKVNVREIADAYQKALQYPIVAGAAIKRLDESRWTVKVKSSTRNVDRMELENSCRLFVVSKQSSGLQVLDCADICPDKSILAEHEKAGSRVVLVSEQKNDKKTFTVNLYRENRLRKSIKLLDFDVHGPVVMKEPFAAFTLSHDGTRVLYIAEKKIPTPKSFFEKDRKPKEKEDSSPLGTEYLLKQNWGEQYTDIFSTVVCVLDLNEETIKVTEIPDHSLSSPFWVGNKNDQVAFVAINEHPRKLGRVFCTNRQSSLWKRNLNETDSTPLAGEGEKLCIHSPVVNPAGTHVVFLQNAMGGAHLKASEVVLFDLNARSKKVLCGLDSALYLDALPQSCWKTDGSAVLFSSSSGGAEVLWQVDVNTCSLVKIACPLASAQLLTADHDLAVIAASSFVHVPQVFVCEIDSSFDAANPKWTQVTEKIEIEDIVYQSEIVADNVQAHLVSPRHLAKQPSACMLVIHGGPHSTADNSFLGSVLFFTSLGFKLLIPNYRGSTGVNEATLNSLPGHVGTNDVSDCIETTKLYIKKGLIKPDELFLWGGSHGGFLVCHLAGQHPDFNWVALSTRNPVVDMASMVQITDIPDWCWFESFGDDRYFTQVLDEQTVAKMFSMSPFKHVSRVKTPSLVLLGSDDLRVPMPGGLRWHQELKRAGVPTKCHVYPDGHGLAKVPVDADCLINSVIWYLQHLEKKRST